eukprot:CAMPEP_0197863914 /NCGR_PEP_ID=MMETSP1438-20131217/41729_1 /TAXON_ID=1461541 /ORGANISM="Pterosperma sp., Strain CCMP1384" /LENGTH=557 /DNA_ID=CAMNT_0043481975 /DNA_START=207 /DNA_END=1880 /DNA_ORIENTATION=+
MAKILVGVSLHLFGSVSITAGQALVKLASSLADTDEIVNQLEVASGLRKKQLREGSSGSRSNKRKANESDTCAESPPTRVLKFDGGASDAYRAASPESTGSSPGKQGPNEQPPEGHHQTFLDKLPFRVVHRTGWLAFVAGNISRFASYGFAPQTTLSALVSAQFVFLPIWAWALMGESINFTIVVAIGVVIMGNGIMLAFTSSSIDQVSSLQLLKDSWTAPSMIGYLCGAVSLSVSAQLVYSFARCKLDAHVSNPSRRPIPFCMVLPMLFSISSALIGTISVIFAKSLALMMVMGWSGQFADYYLYLVIACLVATQAFWLQRMSEGLSTYKVELIAPMLQVAWMVGSVVSGGLYWGEFEAMAPLNLGGYLGGLAMILMGLVAFARGSYQDAEREELVKERELESMLREFDNTEDQSLKEIINKVHSQLQYSSMYAVDNIRQEMNQDVRNYRHSLQADSDMLPEIRRWERRSRLNSVTTRGGWYWTALGTMHTTARMNTRARLRAKWRLGLTRTVAKTPVVDTSSFDSLRARGASSPSAWEHQEDPEGVYREPIENFL